MTMPSGEVRARMIQMDETGLFDTLSATAFEAEVVASFVAEGWGVIDAIFGVVAHTGCDALELEAAYAAITPPTITDKWGVEGRGSFWSRTEYAGVYDVEFDTEQEARRAVDDLVRVCGVARAERAPAQ